MLNSPLLSPHFGFGWHVIAALLALLTVAVARKLYRLSRRKIPKSSTNSSDGKSI